MSSEPNSGLPLSPVWRTYRAWGRLAWIGFIALLLTGSLQAIVHGDGAGFTVARWTSGVVWWVAFGRVGSFRCPRCRRWFYTRLTPLPLGHTNFFSRKCLNCGLPKWTDP